MSLASTIGLTIQLPKFEGPLSLLLYLIKKEEMDIFDIEIHRITNQYFEYIRQMKEMDLEVAGEFVAMAATLIQIKSQLLLPQYNEAGEVIEVEDPRKELVQRLLEYQKFQDAAKELAQRPWLGRDVWNRGFREKFDESVIEEIELEDNALFSLIASYRKAIRSVQKRIHKVAAKTQSVASRIMEIRDRLFINQRVPMSELITAIDDRRRQVLMTFLSALELAKMGFVRLFQTEAQQEIYIEALREIDASGISRVEEYEKVQDTPMNEGLIAETGGASVPTPTSPAQLSLVENSDLGSGDSQIENLAETEIETRASTTPVVAVSPSEIDQSDVSATVSSLASSAAANLDFLSSSAPNATEIELTDAEALNLIPDSELSNDFAMTEEENLDEGLEMATDEDILAAEQELANLGEDLEVESAQTTEPTAELSAEEGGILISNQDHEPTGENDGTQEI